MGAARRLVENGLPVTLAMLDRSIEALEAYAEVTAPADAETSETG
jgi:hypothetical protein